jgi:hypothetical protein
MVRRLSLLLICLALGVCSFVILDIWHFENLKPLNKLQTLWEEDVNNMREANQLPAAWNSIREIVLTPGDEQAKQWLLNLQIPVYVRKDGQYKLQVMLVTWDDEGKNGVYLQYDMMDLRNNENTVWEDNRTFILSDENSWFEKYFKHPVASHSQPAATSH